MYIMTVTLKNFKLKLQVKRKASQCQFARKLRDLLKKKKHYASLCRKTVFYTQEINLIGREGRWYE